MTTIITWLLALWLAFVGGLGSSGSGGQHAGRVSDDVLPLVAPATVPQSVPTPRPSGHIVPPYVAIRGTATWYRYRSGYAAAGAPLRALLGPGWRGMRVRVCHASACVFVRLTDYESSTIPDRIIDLDRADFARLAPLGRGLVSVVVSR